MSTLHFLRQACDEQALHYYSGLPKAFLTSFFSIQVNYYAKELFFLMANSSNCRRGKPGNCNTLYKSTNLESKGESVEVCVAFLPFLFVCFVFGFFFPNKDFFSPPEDELSVATDTPCNDF